MTTTTQPLAKQTNSFPNGPESYGFRETLKLIFNPLPALEESRNRYGDIYSFPGISNLPPSIILGNPQSIEELFTANTDLFDSGASNAALKPLLGDMSILQLDGNPHQQRRKLLMPSFHGQRLQSYGNIIIEITEKVIKQWKINQPFLMRNVTQEITLKVILKAVFGVNEGEYYDQLRQKFSHYLDLFNSPIYTTTLFLNYLQKDLGSWSPWGHFQRQKQAIYELLSQEIETHRQQDGGEDILSLLLSTTDEDGNPLSKAEIMDELVTLLFAGHDTTASALAWAFYWIHSQPDVYHNLMNELGTIDAETDPTNIAKLPYLNAVVSETLRIYPIALFAFGRMLKSPLDLMGYSFDKGTIFSPCIYLVHHHPEVYPNSKTFKPERFLERQFSPYEFIPFGGSNRRCLGYALALYEMKLVLATVLQKTALKLASSRPVVPVRRGFIMTASGGVKMIATKIN
ncbi:cytochrome P450 [Rippkaea orientalis PCC 8801]|uniref:Cytochrome P450 n=1 Tax=Rippkaea orientalis (strain PCC 8801 / RF-1) TaxID=41431 RepID=B7K4F3_RIPO1|nr:cytochrome P450 [Rippkaea orientalis]ACK65418.1 cytochrome P450 [Rippkaea orientalis PCC 8801]